MEKLKIEISNLQPQNQEVIQSKTDTEQAEVKAESEKSINLVERVLSSSKSFFTKVKRTLSN